MMVLNVEDGLECEVYVDGISSEHVSGFKYLWNVLDKLGTDRVDGIRIQYILEFKYLRCVMNKSGTDGAKWSRKVVSGRRVAVNASARDLQIEYAKVLHETLLVPVLMHGSEREKERSRIKAV